MARSYICYNAGKVFTSNSGAFDLKTAVSRVSTSTPTLTFTLALTLTLVSALD